MSEIFNELGQPIGFAVPDWHRADRPTRLPLVGHFCRLEPLTVARHAADLFTANSVDTEGRMWTYMPYGPFSEQAAYETWVDSMAGRDDPFFYAIIDQATGKAVGVASYLRIDPGNGVIEVGHIAYAPALQRTPAATEAMYLLMQQVFTLGYRRYEWKCDALNAPSRRAAQRLGFSFEGIFRQAVIYKGRNRDTAWYATIDQEWPALQKAFEQWLAPENFDAEGQQQQHLSDLTAPILKQWG
ncbi:MAG: GNAT family N-acetyltransferase [Anaerolineae bacterium]|nr:GNAT family N-acetyltransferase [Anaerolineae bacterium]